MSTYTFKVWLAGNRINHRNVVVEAPTREDAYEIVIRELNQDEIFRLDNIKR